MKSLVAMLFRGGASAALAVAVLVSGVVPSARCEDWPQAQGIHRDNKSPETGLLQQWPEGGPELAWKITTAGLGYSGPAVVGDRIYLTGARNGRAELFALNAEDGSELWSVPLNEKAFDFKGNVWGVGPRATPTVADEQIFALAGDGQLVCCDTNGKIRWQVGMVEDLAGQVNDVGGGPKVYGWGYCWSPLIDGPRLICVPGGNDGTLAALDTKTGDVLWRSSELTEMATYSSPVKATFHGVPQYITMTQSGVAGVSTDGALLWHYERKRPYSDVVIPTPLVHGNQVYISNGSDGSGCDLIDISLQDGKFSAESTYTSRTTRVMKNYMGGYVLHDGFVYGCSEGRGWVCQEFVGGTMKWYKKGAGALGDGSIVYADGHLYLFAERESDVALIEASSEEWKLKGKFTIPQSEQRATNGHAWTHPVIAGGRLYLRDQELFLSYSIK